MRLVMSLLPILDRITYHNVHSDFLVVRREMDVATQREAKASVERIIEDVGGLDVAGETFCVSLEVTIKINIE